MTPDEFKNRFLSANRKIAQIRPIEFVTYELENLKDLKISSSDTAILYEIGLPKSARPMLSFGSSEFEKLERLTDISPEVEPEYAIFHPFGGNAYGDLICIDETDGHVLYHNHDLGMKEVFVNSSVTHLAKTLCLFSEWFEKRDEIDFLSQLKAIDPSAVAEGSMWPSEYEEAIE